MPSPHPKRKGLDRAILGQASGRSEYDRYTIFKNKNKNNCMSKKFEKYRKYLKYNKNRCFLKKVNENY